MDDRVVRKGKKRERREGIKGETSAISNESFENRAELIHVKSFIRPVGNEEVWREKDLRMNE